MGYLLDRCAVTNARPAQRRTRRQLRRGKTAALQRKQTRRSDLTEQDHRAIGVPLTTVTCGVLRVIMAGTSSRSATCRRTIRQLQAGDQRSERQGSLKSGLAGLDFGPTDINQHVAVGVIGRFQLVLDQRAVLPPLQQVPAHLLTRLGVDAQGVVRH